MTEFRDQDLTGARFEDVDLKDAWFRNVHLTGARLRGVWAEGVLDIDGDVAGLRVNGIDVGPYVEAELARRHPEYALLRPQDADGFRAAWAAVEGQWPATIERARALPPELLHERVDDEWSFIETQRHLVFATDAWVRRAVLGNPEPYYPLGLQHDEMEPDPAVPLERDARPSLDEVWEVRRQRMDEVGEVIAGLTDEELAADATGATGPGYPEAGSYPTRRCLGAIVNEEWWHHRYAVRDLAVLEERGH